MIFCAEYKAAYIKAEAKGNNNNNNGDSDSDNSGDDFPLGSKNKYIKIKQVLTGAKKVGKRKKKAGVGKRGKEKGVKKKVKKEKKREEKKGKRKEPIAGPSQAYGL